MQSLRDAKSFTIVTQDRTSSTTDAFLQRKADGYRVLFLDKNGEAQAGRVVFITLDHRHLGNKNCTLTTDREGRVLLGSLEDVKQIFVGLRSKQSTSEEVGLGPRGLFSSSSGRDDCDEPIHAQTRFVLPTGNRSSSSSWHF
jgi:hypothetical protein